MNRVVLPLLCMLLVTAASLAIPSAIFEDTVTFAKRGKDILIAKCDRVPEEHEDLGGGVHAVGVTVKEVFKGTTPVGALKVATDNRSMRVGKTYLLSSLGGSVADITFVAAGDLSVVELPDRFDLSRLKDKTLEEQLNAIFSARKAEVEFQLETLKREADLLTKAIGKKSA